MQALRSSRRSVNDRAHEQGDRDGQSRPFRRGDEAAENAAENADREKKGPGRFLERLPHAGEPKFLLDRKVVTHGLNVGGSPAAPMIPGMMPATNNLTTEVCAITAYRIIGIDGGMMMARLAADEVVAAANSAE